MVELARKRKMQNTCRAGGGGGGGGAHRRSPLHVPIPFPSREAQASDRRDGAAAPAAVRFLSGPRPPGPARPAAVHGCRLR